MIVLIYTFQCADAIISEMMLGGHFVPKTVKVVLIFWSIKLLAII